ncbi:hypothetical protein GUJ93_ZPchr0003g17478 [Zizania palustris]|uniref:Uncharacterized protein n=1 Tax=Zizania palustris TaxID=103762 RepID=A0A8J5SSY4_ZIZPA|nr:hypothetical protein GUJ93_ZPchr0003g17478 [Zizania palustris]
MRTSSVVQGFKRLPSFALGQRRSTELSCRCVAAPHAHWSRNAPRPPRDYAGAPHDQTALRRPSKALCLFSCDLSRCTTVPLRWRRCTPIEATTRLHRCATRLGRPSVTPHARVGLSCRYTATPLAHPSEPLRRATRLSEALVPLHRHSPYTTVSHHNLRH